MATIGTDPNGFRRILFIASDGTRCTLVPDEHVAWHAGASTFLGRTRCNDFLLGLAFAGDTYVIPLTSAQIASALEWLAPRFAEHHWPLSHISDHRARSTRDFSRIHPAFPQSRRCPAARATWRLFSPQRHAVRSYDRPYAVTDE